MKTCTITRFVLVALSGCSLLAACEKGFGVENGRRVIVVLAEVTAGDTAVVPVGKSLLTTTGTSIQFDKISNADVDILDANNTQTHLAYHNGTEFAGNPAAVYTAPLSFKAGAYRLEVRHPSLGVATASTTIPEPVVAQQVSQDDAVQNGRPVMVFNFTLADPPSERNYYVFEAVKQSVALRRYFFYQGNRVSYDSAGGKELYDREAAAAGSSLLRDTVPLHGYTRLELYTYDKRTENNAYGLDNTFDRIFISDSLFNGQLYPTFFSVVKAHFEDAAAPGRVLIRVKSVSRELYEYLLSYQKYKAAFGTVPTTHLPSLKGNINNGFGVFGGASKKEWVFYYDKLE